MTQRAPFNPPLRPVRVAWIAPYLPAPENTGGRIRMAQLARALVKHGTIDLFSCGGAQEYAHERAHANGALSMYEQCFVRGRTPSVYWYSRFNPFTKIHERVRTATPISLFFHLWNEHRKRPYDLAVVSHSYAMGLAGALSQCPIILDEHNIESAYAVQTDQAKLSASEQRNRERHHKVLRQWEKHAWQQAAHVTCVCEEDFRTIVGDVAFEERVSVVPNGSSVNATRWMAPSDRAKSGKNAVLFVGLMSHAPNEKAAEWMAKEVMPKVWSNPLTASAQLVLCGRQPSAAVKALAQDSRVIVTGTVDSVAPYLEQARVVVNPLHHGAGSSLKSVEALACGAPVVSTAVGMRGIDGAAHTITHEQADDVDSFAQAITTVWQRSEEGAISLDARSRTARAIAESYDWSMIGERFAHTVLRTFAEFKHHPLPPTRSP